MQERKVDMRLIKRVLKGDKESFNLLVLKYQHKVAKLVSRYVFEPSDVTDVTQEVFIKVYRSLDKFRGESAFYTWLYRIAVNTAKNYMLDRARRPPDTDIDIDDANLNIRTSKLREYETPENLLLRDEIQKTVNNTVDELPDELRIAIVLREMDGLTYEEIAEVMQCPVGTVRSRLFRAREAIDEKLKNLLDDK